MTTKAAETQLRIRCGTCVLGPEVMELLAKVRALRAALEARQVYAPLLSTEQLTQLLEGDGYEKLPIQRQIAEFELKARTALDVPE